MPYRQRSEGEITPSPAGNVNIIYSKRSTKPPEPEPTVPPEKNRLYGDNLRGLRDYIPDSSVDLIYLDPPFNSRQDYNVLFAERDGSPFAPPRSPP